MARGRLERPTKSAELCLPDPYRVQPSDALLERLALVLGRDAVALDYGGSGS